ncbi:MAG TPA: hypothetical protein VN778_01820 [Verrucomicrobiae bacterium]|nr:hypothetical protein [Verrucomicrobiae bacterium]
MAQGKSTKKPVVKQRVNKVAVPAEVIASKPRRLKLPAYKPFRLKRVKYPEKLPSVWRLSAQTAQLVARRPWLFAGIAVVYAVLTLILVRGFGSGIDVASLKTQLDTGPSHVAQLLTGVSVLVAMLNSSGTSAGDTSGAYQIIVGLVVSLATIWAARQTLAGQSVGLRDAFYKGIYPLIPFVLVLLVVILESLPFLIGAWLYTTLVMNGIVATTLEQVIWGIVCFVLVVISLYMLCSSLFALYIVTLPDMRPIKALRSARQLVRYRRGQVFRKLLYLPVALLVITAVVMVPAILLVAGAATWVFFVWTTLILLIVHVYMYTLYKALLA